MSNPLLDGVFSRYGVTMSIEECADLFGVKPQQIRRRLRLPEDDPRRIPGFLPNGANRWIIPTAAVRTYVEASAGHRVSDASDNGSADATE